MARSPLQAGFGLTRTHGERRLPALSPTPGVVRTHLDELTGSFGIYQHARGRLPNPGLGYCTDDVARAAIVDVLHGRELGSVQVRESLERSIRFLAAAVQPRTGRLRNFRDDDGNWLERAGSPDAQARGVQALGLISAEDADDEISRVAAELLDELLPGMLDLADLRPWAHVILGCVAATAGRRPPHAVRIVIEELADRLFGAFETGAIEWPWPEVEVTYENAVLAQALLEAGRWLGDQEMVDRGLSTLDWLLTAQVAEPGYLQLVGNRGWWPRGGEPAVWDQQPIDAASFVETCAAAWRVSGQRAWLDEMERAFAWFLGANSASLPVADPQRGACADGLSPIGPSANEGAESTLAWLTAVECVRASRRAAA